MLEIRQNGLAWAAANASVATFAAGAVAHVVAGPVCAVVVAVSLGIAFGLARRDTISAATLGIAGLGSVLLCMITSRTAFEMPLFAFVTVWLGCYFYSLVRQSWLNGLVQAHDAEKASRNYRRSMSLRFHLAMRELENQSLAQQTERWNAPAVRWLERN